jgi:hypothetical protein
LAVISWTTNPFGIPILGILLEIGPWQIPTGIPIGSFVWISPLFTISASLNVWEQLKTIIMPFYFCLLILKLFCLLINHFKSSFLHEWQAEALSAWQILVLQSFVSQHMSI